MNKNIKQKNKESQSNLASSVLSRINDEKKEPLPRWRFVLKNQTFWILWVLSVLIGAVSVAAIIFVVLNSGWKYRIIMHDSFLGFFFQTFPVLWIVSLIFFIFLGYENFKYTKKGYRYSFASIVLASIGASLLGGVILYQFGLGNVIDQDFGKHIPFHTPILMHQKEAWTNPEDGFLVGNVLEINIENNNMILETFKGDLWRVDMGDLRESDLRVLESFSEIRIVGLPSEAEEFHACFIFPWKIFGRGYDSKPGQIKPALDFIKGGERNIFEERSNDCKDVRPYKILQTLQ